MKNQYLFPANVLVGKSVFRPAGKREYLCTSEPTEDNVTNEKASEDDFYFGEVVYLNSGGYSNMWAAQNLLKSELTQEDLINIRDKYGLPEDYKVKYFRGEQRMTSKLGELIN